MRPYLNKTTAVALSIVGAGAAPLVVHAQEDSSSAGVLEEVVVTARRRAENLQDVPIAVSAITGDQAELFG